MRNHPDLGHCFNRTMSKIQYFSNAFFDKLTQTNPLTMVHLYYTLSLSVVYLGFKGLTFGIARRIFLIVGVLLAFTLQEYVSHPLM